MDIHRQIKAAREAKGWSMERLAREVSEAEGLAKPLTWQAVQQWENGTSAPKRTRMTLVARLLELDADQAQKGAVFEALDTDEIELIRHWRQLLIHDREEKLVEIEALGKVRKAEREEILAEAGLTRIAERAALASRERSATSVDPHDPSLKQQPLFEGPNREKP